MMDVENFKFYFFNICIYIYIIVCTRMCVSKCFTLIKGVIYLINSAIFLNKFVKSLMSMSRFTDINVLFSISTKLRIHFNMQARIRII
jgi:hypothetical protein